MAIENSWKDPRAQRKKTTEERFLEKIEVMPKCGCWFWRAFTDRKGYGLITINKRAYKAHHVSWMLYRGDIPEGMHVLHKCDRPICTNPEHLFLGTELDNALDREQKGRGGQRKGEGNGNAKLTEEQAKYIIAISKQEGLPRGWQRRLAEKFSVTHGAIYRVVRRRSWRWLHEETTKAENCNNKRADQRSL